MNAIIWKTTKSEIEKKSKLNRKLIKYQQKNKVFLNTSVYKTFRIPHKTDFVPFFFILWG